MKIIALLLCELLAGCASNRNYSHGFGIANTMAMAPMTNARRSVPLADTQSQIAPSGAVLPTFIPSGSSSHGALPMASNALLLFGGESRRIFLGCVNCNEYDADSIRNEYGTYGSKYSDLSIWNPYGDYGSRYSNDSPWNEYASNPPVVVDNAGNFYGYFTVNTFNPKRTRIQSLLVLLAANSE